MKVVTDRTSDNNNCGNSEDVDVTLSSSGEDA